jgi:hypothetical protein
MKCPLLEGIRKRAGVSALADDAARLLSGSSGFADDALRLVQPVVRPQPQILTGIRRLVGRHPLMTLGAGGAGGYMLANRMGQGKAYQQGSQDMMRQMGPYAASMNAPQGAMGMPAWARPPERRM